MTNQEEQLIRHEVRQLRQQNANFKRAHQQQKDRANKLENEVKTLRQKNKQLKEENKSLKLQLESINNHARVLKGMIFKTNLKKTDASPGQSKKTRGGQAGHRGKTRTKPTEFDFEKECFLTNCPHCDNELEQTNTTHDRIIEDIPIQQVTTTLYHIQHQWCAHCHREVHAEPPNTLPGFRLGLNLITWILFNKYKLRAPLNRMVESLKEQYSLTISQGTIQNILHRLKQKFGPKYQEILEIIRTAEIKNADETGWRILGQNVWCWLFATFKAAYYTIEETRGKGVPEQVLGPRPRGVLVRDDFGSYDKLSMEHQSCWAHLLRKSHETIERDEVSSEARQLHEELKSMFKELNQLINRPFNQKDRLAAFKHYQKRINQIQKRKYQDSDVQAVQTRIINQGNNLITALKHDGVPLTNNHAERQIRPMTVIRKISGGSRSNQGASTHAVNMSIVQTLALEGKSFFQGIKELLSAPKVYQYSLERAE